MFTNTTNI